MRAEIIRAAGLTATPWKNAGGVTREIMAWPSGSDLSNFLCRVSMAQVTEGGPFSYFPGVDRILTVLEGALTLEISDREVRLDAASDPWAFPGEIAVSARRPADPVTDLNVMTRRGEVSARVERVSLSGATALLDLEWALILCRDGAVTLGHGEQTWRLRRHDSLCVFDATRLVATPTGSSAPEVLVARFRGCE